MGDRDSRIEVKPVVMLGKPVVQDTMNHTVSASIWREGSWYISQCREVDVASQGETEEQALANLREALELYFEPPSATRPPLERTVAIEIDY